MHPVNPTRLLGAALIALGLAFNLPYARLAATFDYPGILREPPETILAALVAGGPALILTWYAFAACALIFAPLGMAHAMTQGRMTRSPALAVAAAIAGALAGILQAMGLLRWVLVVPQLAGMPDAATTFAAVHAMGGALMGEHMGQLLTALHVGLIGVMQAQERQRGLAVTAFATSGIITIGSFETVALALGGPGDAFGLAAIAGYLGLTLWLLWSGAALIRSARHP
jgi:hypothetical protein